MIQYGQNHSLAGLYECTGRAIGLSLASGSVVVALGAALALALGTVLALAECFKFYVILCDCQSTVR